jgi:hypothetical protein
VSDPVKTEDMHRGRDFRGNALKRKLWTSGLALVVAAVLVPTASGCAFTHSGCWSFNASLATPTGGAKTPLGAAQDFVKGDKTRNWPQSGWVAAAGNSGAFVSVTSGRYTLTASKGTDGTWFIVAGRNCT